MQHTISLILNKDEIILPVIFKINKRTNKVILHPEIDALKITIPSPFYMTTALEFAKTKKEWLSKQLTKKQKISLDIIDEIVFLDKIYKIIPTNEKLGVQIQNDIVLVSGNPEFRGRRLNDFFKKEFTKYVEQRIKHYGNILKKHPTKIVIKSVSSRHGSCSSLGHICISDKLLFAPCYVIDYIISHEVAHLKEMNHSPKFWKLCDELYLGNSEQAKAWLRLNI